MLRRSKLGENTTAGASPRDVASWGVDTHPIRAIRKPGEVVIYCALTLGCAGRTSLDSSTPLVQGGSGGSTSAVMGGNSTSIGSSVAGGTVSTEPSSGGSTTSAGTSSNCDDNALPRVVGAIESSELAELSGLVASREHAGILYAHADSGAAPEIVAFDESGATLGTIRLLDTLQIDWEDVSIGVVPDGNDYVYVGDIGDNAARNGNGGARESVAVYRFPEPDPGELSRLSTLAVANWERASLGYPDVQHDAEALFVDPVSQDIILVTKEDSGQSLVFRASSAAFASDDVTLLEQVGELTVGTAGQWSAMITAGDISAAGDRVLIRSYTDILLFERLDTWEGTFASAPTILLSVVEPQGEALTFNADGTAWLSAGEQINAINKGSFECLKRRDGP